MGLPLPAPLVPLATELGATWPDADETAMTSEALRWQAFADTARTVAEDCTLAVGTMTARNHGAGVAAFSLWWQRLGGPAGHHSLSISVAEALARIWAGMALYVWQLKVYVYEQLLAYATAKTAVAMAESPAGPVLLVLAEYGEAMAKAIGEYVDWTLEAIEALGREVIPLVDQLTAHPISVLRNRPVHQGRDRVMTPEDQAPIGERLARARNLSDIPGDGRARRRGRDFPDMADPSAVIKDVAPDGTLKRYAVYDSEGNISKRIDMQGRPHKGIYGEEVPTPHVVHYRRDSAPGHVRINVRPDKQVRPAHPEELP